MFELRTIIDITQWSHRFVVFFCAFSIHTVNGVEVQSPTDVLRDNVAAAIEILEDPKYLSQENLELQRDQLCFVTQNMFDIHAFSRLILTKTWLEMSERQQGDFIESLSSFLCRYYLSELQSRYTGETVEFKEQIYKSDTLANVSGLLHWKGLEIPFKVRMVKRENRWRAYDIAVAGISAVIIYRTQFQDRLKHITIDALIDEIKNYAPAED